MRARERHDLNREVLRHFLDGDTVAHPSEPSEDHAAAFLLSDGGHVRARAALIAEGLLTRAIVSGRQRDTVIVADQR